MKLFQVLGNVDIPDAELRIGLELFESPDFHDWEYRNPYAVRQHKAGTEWHKDGLGGIGGLVLWTNVYPTEIKLPNGKIVKGDPNDVMLIDNIRVAHRTPPDYFADYSGVARHFVRLWLSDYPFDSRIELWEESIRNKQALWHPNQTNTCFDKEE